MKRHKDERRKSMQADLKITKEIPALDMKQLAAEYELQWSGGQTSQSIEEAILGHIKRVTRLADGGRL